VAAHLPTMQSKLADNRHSSVTETEHLIPLTTGFTSRTLVCRPTNPEQKGPVIILFHGGGGCLGFPELELPLARELVLAHGATAVLPSTRLAPEDPFPAGVNDAWAVLQFVAAQLSGDDAPAASSSPALPLRGASPALGFIVGGSSSGANLAGVLCHLARDAGLAPPLTGQLLSCGGWIEQSRVPARFAARYLSREQNAESPMVAASFDQAFKDELKPDRESGLWAPVDGGEATHRGIPPAYFAICGMDMNRDDGLIYERVLREECGLATRVDLYRGWPHCFWDAYPELEESGNRTKNIVKAVGWLVGLRGGDGRI
jgi:acetyl esterase/lipase